MRAFWALMRREFFEHRKIFVWAPIGLTALLVVLIATAVVAGRIDAIVQLAAISTRSRLYEALYVAVAALWWIYLSMTLFFYFADSFNADSRNSSMLFWKSLPQSDFRILLAKTIAGLTLFPALVFVAALLGGIILAATTLVLPQFVGGLAVPDPAALAGDWARISSIMLVYMALALLWFAPFLAWVGALSTVTGRWSIPLAIIIPLIISLFENAVNFSFVGGGGAVLGFLRQRLDFSYNLVPITQALSSPEPLDVGRTSAALVAGAQWPSLLGGLVFALLVIYGASEYRRRYVLRG